MNIINGNVIRGLSFVISVFFLYIIVRYFTGKLRPDLAHINNESFTDASDVVAYKNILEFIRTKIGDQEGTWFDMECNFKPHITLIVDKDAIRFKTHDFFVQTNNAHYYAHGDPVLLIAFTSEMQRNIENTARYIKYIVNDILAKNNNAYTYCQFMLRDKKIAFSDYTFSKAKISISHHKKSDILENTSAFLATSSILSSFTATTTPPPPTTPPPTPTPKITLKGGIDVTSVLADMEELKAAGKASKAQAADMKNNVSQDSIEPDTFTTIKDSKITVNYNVDAMEFINTYIDIPNKTIKLSKNTSGPTNIVDALFLLDESHFLLIKRLIDKLGH